MSKCSARPSRSLVPLQLRTGAKARGFSPTPREFTAETDSPLEGAGFEPSVPRKVGFGFRSFAVWRRPKILHFAEAPMRRRDGRFEFCAHGGVG